jgi:hypothetical protein
MGPGTASSIVTRALRFARASSQNPAARAGVEGFLGRTTVFFLVYKDPGKGRATGTRFPIRRTFLLTRRKKTSF